MREESNNKLAKIAEKAVSLASEEYKIDLDYSLNSLDQLEEIILKIESKFADKIYIDKPKAFRENLSRLWGVYLGEIIRKELGGDWLEMVRGTGYVFIGYPFSD